MIHFYKNLVMAGGFLYVFAYGAGAISVDNRKALRSAENTAVAPGGTKFRPVNFISAIAFDDL